MEEKMSWFKDTIYTPYERILTNLLSFANDHRQNINDRMFIMRMFTFDNCQEGPSQVAETIARLEVVTQVFFQSFFLFKLKQNDKHGRTHGVFAQFKQYFPRKRVDMAVKQMFSLFSQQYEIRNVLPITPHITKMHTITSYVQQIYGQKQNLLYKFVHVKDMVNVNQYTLNSGKTSKVLVELRASLRMVLDNMISMPKTYQHSLLNRILLMKRDDFYEYMKFNTLDMVVQDIINNAYDIAVQSVSLADGHEQLLTDVLTRFSVSKSVQTERVEKQLQSLIRDCFGEIFIHPDPFVKVHQNSHIADHGVLDLLLFDHRFTMQILLVSRWFSRVCLQSPADISNNYANLVLYGTAGSGKSLILSALQKCIPTYTYLTSGHFQNPDILSSSLIYFGEFQSHQLVQSLYKDLFDIKSSIKVDFKNIHPENVSQNVPIILSTNDDVISTLRSLPHKRISHFHSNMAPVNENSVQAALRRLYLIPMRYGSYLHLHADVKDDNPNFQELSKYNGRLMKEPNLLERLFNTIVALAFFQSDLPSMTINMRMKSYVKQIVDAFINTYFGQFYYQYANDIRSTVLEYEQHMFTMDVNDSELAMCNIRASNNIGQFMRVWIQYNTAGYSSTVSPDSKVLTVNQLKTVSQPIMVYYLMEHDPRFKESIRAPSIFFLLLHGNIFSYLHGTMGDLYNDEISCEDGDDVENQDQCAAVTLISDPPVQDDIAGQQQQLSTNGDSTSTFTKVPS